MPDSTPTVWGKAGQRLTPAEVERRRRANLATMRQRQLAGEKSRAEHVAEARRVWAAGKVMPWRITLALGDLEGPEVDRACGVEEPTVDHWELGIVYPTWAQIEALAELTGHPTWFICRNEEQILPSHTSMKFHSPAAEIATADEEISRRFLPEAIASTLRAEGVLT